MLEDEASKSNSFEVQTLGGEAMTVKPPARRADADVHELLVLMGRVMPVLKGHDSAPPPAFLRAAEALGGEHGATHGNLGPRHGPLLVLIALEGGLSVSELAARMALSVSTVSLMVGELSRAGLVARSEDERDRRRTLVRLDPEHAEELEAWMRERIAPLSGALARLDPAVRDGFLEGWRRLAEEIEAPDD
jgi:DNA-binding MarR family transcriptional regulator